MQIGHIGAEDFLYRSRYADGRHDRPVVRRDCIGYDAHIVAIDVGAVGNHDVVELAVGIVGREGWCALLANHHEVFFEPFYYFGVGH